MQLIDQANPEVIDQYVLALMYLTTFRESAGYRVWKGQDWEVLGRMHDKGWIGNPKSKVRSVELTEEGRELSQKLFENLFCGISTPIKIEVNVKGNDVVATDHDLQIIRAWNTMFDRVSERILAHKRKLTEIANTTDPLELPSMVRDIAVEYHTQQLHYLECIYETMRLTYEEVE